MAKPSNLNVRMQRIYELNKSITWCLSILLIMGLLISEYTFAANNIPLRERHRSENLQEIANDTAIVQNDTRYLDFWRKAEDLNLSKADGIDLTFRPQDAFRNGENIELEYGIGGKTDGVIVTRYFPDYFEWKVSVPKSGLYNIYIEYFPLEGDGTVIQRSLMINGELPFREAGNLPFSRGWKDEREPFINNLGDEVRPRQVEVSEWRVTPLRDMKGIFSDPFLFYFTENEYMIRFSYVDQPAAFGRMFIRSPRMMPFYEDLLRQYEENGYESGTRRIKIQGEHATEKSDPTLRREFTGDPNASPASDGAVRLNMIGGWRWRTGNQKITWTFNVEERGLYEIAFRTRQWYGDGLVSHRQIAINGEVPFKEVNEYQFEFDRRWRTEVLSDANGEPYLFYLKEGENEISLTVKMGGLREVLIGLEEDNIMLANLIRRIVTITSTEPDPHFDYKLETKIPGLITDLQLLSDNLGSHAEKLIEFSVQRTPMINNFAMLSDQLKMMAEDPYIIPDRLNDILIMQTSLAAWFQDLQNQPLDIDYITISPEGESGQGATTNMFQMIMVTIRNFIQSFFRDYESIGFFADADEVSDGPTIEVWVARGREWGEVIKQMADEEFSVDTGINVDLNVFPAGAMAATGVNVLTLSIISGNAPDVALGVGQIDPMELAFRNAVTDLSRFDDFSGIATRFLPGAMVPFTHQLGGVYALPETMDFQVLFYRRDIVEELDLIIPDTWEELYQRVLPVLHLNGMEFGYGGGAGFGANPPELQYQGFLPFLYQRQGTFYTNDGLRSGLDTEYAFQAFRDWTRLYTIYQIPVTASVYNRFRSGIMPMFVGGFNDYVQLSVAAPELYGRWGIATIPGTEMPDGNINRASGGSVAACIILEQTQYKDEAWEFLKWWTSAETQIRFAREMEAYMGSAARWNTANIEAFKMLPWDERDLAVITEQQKWFKEKPVVYGGYYTSRLLNNAFTSVVMMGEDLRDVLENAVRDINREMRLKQEKYGVSSSE